MPLPRAAVLALLLLGCSPVLAAANPVVPGDHPDPSVTRVDGAFYATATSGDWAPIFPVFRSTDLVRWTQVGAILPAAPAWATGRFWAPEIRRDSGHVTAFYSASRRGGRACIGVATAPRPEGPWRDRGRAVCPPRGAIDAAPVRDVDGTRWLAFKQLGVGGGIYLQRMDRAGLRTTGQPIRLILPDAGWERGVTEGPTFLHHGSWWYLFYSGGNCCRPPCTYAEGVARAPALQGPYAKAPDNPILSGSSSWKCPGHGSVIDLGARGTWLLHHAYRPDDVLDQRREMVLDEIDFGADGWPLLDQGDSPATVARSPFGAPLDTQAGGFADTFAGHALAPGWEWPFARAPAVRVGSGTLAVGCHWRTRFVARQVPAAPLQAYAAIHSGHSAAAGLALTEEGELRGVELAGGQVRQFAAPGDQGARVGPGVAAPAGPTVVVALAVGADGSLTASVAAPGGPPVPVPAGPASAGPPPTRLALTCRGRGAALFDAAGAQPAS